MLSPSPQPARATARVWAKDACFLPTLVRATILSPTRHVPSSHGSQREQALTRAVMRLLPAWGRCSPISIRIRPCPCMRERSTEAQDSPGPATSPEPHPRYLPTSHAKHHWGAQSPFPPAFCPPQHHPLHLTGSSAPLGLCRKVPSSGTLSYTSEPGGPTCSSFTARPSCVHWDGLLNKCSPCYPHEGGAAAVSAQPWSIPRA